MKLSRTVARPSTRQCRPLPRRDVSAPAEPGFGFAAARSALDYLVELGITDVYASPLLHGDARQHARLRRGRPRAAEPGARHAAGLQAGRNAEKREGPGTPRRLGPEPHGDRGRPESPGGTTCSRTAPPRSTPTTSTSTGAPPKKRSTIAVLLPILGDAYGDVLERGELRVVWDGAVKLALLGSPAPARPKTIIPLLEDAPRVRPRDRTIPVGKSSRASSPRSGISRRAEETDPSMRAERAREKEVVKRRLAALLAQSEEIGVRSTTR